MGPMAIEVGSRVPEVEEGEHHGHWVGGEAGEDATSGITSLCAVGGG